MEVEWVEAGGAFRRGRFEEVVCLEGGGGGCVDSLSVSVGGMRVGAVRLCAESLRACLDGRPVLSACGGLRIAVGQRLVDM